MRGTLWLGFESECGDPIHANGSHEAVREKYVRRRIFFVKETPTRRTSTKPAHATFFVRDKFTFAFKICAVYYSHDSESIVCNCTVTLCNRAFWLCMGAGCSRAVST